MKFGINAKRAALALSIVLVGNNAYSADVVKANNTDQLDVATSWVGGVLPGAGDIVVFDSTYNARRYDANLTYSNTAVTIAYGGIRIANVSGLQNTNPYDFDNTNDAFGVLMRQGANNKNITLGAGGIDMSAATQGLYLQNVTGLTASQTWNIPDVNQGYGILTKSHGEDFLLGGATNRTLNMNGNTLTTTGSGTIMVADGYTLTNGTININNPRFVLGGGRTSNSAARANLITNATVNVGTGSTLVLQPQALPSNENGRAEVTASVVLNNSTLLLTTHNNANSIKLRKGSLTGTGTLIKAGQGRALIDGADGVNQVISLGSGSLIDVRGGLLRNENGSSGYSGNLADLQVGINAIFDIWDGNNTTVDAMTGIGILNKGWNGDKTLTVGIDNGSGEYDGLIYGNKTNFGYGGSGGGSLRITKVGTGTQILGGKFGDANGTAYSGNTTIQGGSLIFGGDQVTNSAVTAFGGTTFGIRVATAGTTVVAPNVLTASGATIDLLTGSTGNPTAPVLTVTGALDSAGTTVRVTGTSLSAGTAIPLIQYGSLPSGFGGLALEVPARTVANLVDNFGSSRVDLDIVSTDQARWAGGPTWAANGAGWVLNSDGVTATTYLEGSANNGSGVGGTDVVYFTDSGIATPTVDISGAVNPYGIVINNTSGNYTFSGSGSIGGVGQLVKNNAGTLVVANSGNNTYSGGTVINAGTVKVGDGTTVGAGNLGVGAILNNGTLTIDRPDSFKLFQTVVGTGNLVKENTNTVTLKNAGAFNGTVTVNAGRIKFEDTITPTRNSVFVANGSGAVEFAAENQSYMKVLNGSISGTGSIVKTGGGEVWLDGAGGNPTVIALTGANSVIDVQAGLLRNENGNNGWANNKAALNIGLAGIFDIWDGNTVVDFISGSGRINQAWDQNHSLTFGVNNGSGTFSGLITNTDLGYGAAGTNRALTLIKEGTGTQTFTGRIVNGGGITVNGGMLVINPTYQNVANGSSINYSGNTTLNNNATIKFDFSSGTQVIRGAKLQGNGTFIKTGTSALQLGDNGAPIVVELTAGSLIDIQGGTLKNDWGNGQNTDAWANNLAALNVAAGAVFDLWDGAARVDYISGAGTISVSSGDSRLLKIGTNNGSGTFSGTLSNPGAGAFPGPDNYTYGGGGTLSLEKLGTGTQILSSVSTYIGNTTVSAGTLDITGSHTTGANYSVASGANLITTSIRVTNALTLDGNATVYANGGTTGASKVETLTINAGGKLNLKDNDLVVGTGTVSAVRDQIKLGLAGASGITSDLPAFAVSTGFGYALGNDAAISPLLAGSLSGQSYDADSVLVKYTFLGDADLDGDSDLNDLGLWAQSFTGDLGNPAIPVTFWTSGDFDYDGDTDLNDLGFWAGTFTGDLGGGAGSLIVVAPHAPSAAVAALNSMGITVVPEPSTFVLAGVGLVGLAIAKRTRRRKS